MIELTVLSGSCVLELKFIAGQAVRWLALKGNERIVLTGRQEVFYIKPAVSLSSSPDTAVIREQQLQQWYKHFSNILSKS